MIIIILVMLPNVTFADVFFVVFFCFFVCTVRGRCKAFVLYFSTLQQ